MNPTFYTLQCPSETILDNTVYRSIAGELWPARIVSMLDDGLATIDVDAGLSPLRLRVRRGQDGIWTKEGT